jgi:O-antigen ligase
MRNFTTESLLSNSYVYLLALVLATLPLNFAFGSIACLLFILASILFVKKRLVPSMVLFLPISFYFIMILSLTWSADFDSTISSLQKEALFLALPIIFLYCRFKYDDYIEKVFKYFSYSLVASAIFFISKAVINYFETQNYRVFFYHSLVSLDLNAIYIGAFASFALFYFLSVPVKRIRHYISLAILLIFIVLLSSKIIFFIDFLLFTIYYIYFSKTPEGVKVVTVFSITLFILFSTFNVPEIKDTILKGYETAFVDNTLVEEDFQKNNGKYYNVSLSQAWNLDNFNEEHFFPGTALRVFQVRVFKEMLDEQNIFFTGFGLGASQPEIEKKVEEHQLSLGYKIFNFHNQYIQTFAELGVFGFLILVLMLLINLKNAIFNKNFLHLVFALTMIILLLTESMFCRQRGIIFFIILYCIFNSAEHLKPIKEKAQTKK